MGHAGKALPRWRGVSARSPKVGFGDVMAVDVRPSNVSEPFMSLEAPCFR